MSSGSNSLSERVSRGEPAAVARAISRIEDGSSGATELMKQIYQRSRGALVIGITGAPGAGKSSLVDKLAMLYRKRGERVGIVAVDPSSPFSGGAILGDRIRMQALGLDEGVFIRSMATRGNLGGLARATVDAVAILDAAGYAKIIVETVGVGQDEVEIVRTADVSIVTLVPGAGDEVQALKAGIMEIADIFVVNKADREGADRMAAAVDGLLSLETAEAGAWRPPVIRTEATRGIGIDALADAVDRFRQTRGDEIERRRRTRSTVRLRDLVASLFLGRVEATIGAGELESLAARVAARELDPYAAAHLALARVCPGGH